VAAAGNSEGSEWFVIQPSVTFVTKGCAVCCSSSLCRGRDLIRCDTRSYGHSKGELIVFFAMSIGGIVSGERSEVLQGTLDLMILKTLHAMGPLHGFGMARLEQFSEDVLKLNEGTVYTSLLRLQQQGWIAAEWGASENNRKAKFYSITRRGLKQLAVETENWSRILGVIGRALSQEGQG
jgi:PadR family transcriptional regulator PadR